jgi:hypothetical protein
VFRRAGMQVSPITMSCLSPWLHPVCWYKRPLKEEEGLLLFTFCFCLLGLYLGFFWCGKLLEGKRIVEGKMLKGKIAKGKNAKEGLIESLH